MKHRRTDGSPVCVTRRSYLGYVGVTGTVALAGCSGSDDGDSGGAAGTETVDGATEAESGTDTETAGDSDAEGDAGESLSVDWRYTYADATGVAADVTAGGDGGFALVGYDGSGSGRPRTLVVATTSGPDPDTDWGRTYEAAVTDVLSYASIVAFDGGYAYSPPAIGLSLVTLDGSGAEAWRRSYEDTPPSDYGSFILGSEEVFGTGLIRAADSGYLLTGDPGVALKLDSEGSEDWLATVTREIEGQETPWPVTGAARTGDGGYAVSEWGPITADGDGSAFELWPGLVKLDGNGDRAWRRQYRDPLRDAGLTASERGRGPTPYAVDRTADGGFLLAGAGNGRRFALKAGADGDPEWTWSEDTPDSGSAAAGTPVDVAAGDSGHVLAVHGSADTARLLELNGTGEVRRELSVENTVAGSVTRTDDGVVLAGATRSEGESRPSLFKIS